MSRTPLTTRPSADDFRALARSSPWRFATIHFTSQAGNSEARLDEVVEAWLNRPAARVTVRSSRGIEVAEGVPYALSRPNGSAPQAVPSLRSDGLVVSRPSDWHMYYGDPMWRNYQWTAMLDPAELGAGVQVDDVQAIVLRGRATWAATCRPLTGAGEDWEGGYDPRCGCCPLLDSAASRLPEYGRVDYPGLGSADPPTTYRVELDAQTGIAVEIAAVDGWGGLVLSNEIHAVDEPLDPPAR